MIIKTTRCFRLQLLLSALILFYSCNNKPAPDAERKKLLALHQEQQEAHLHKNAKQFVEQFAENMVSVNRGKISVMAKDSALKRFQDYFRDVEFKKWEDVSPPLIEFSRDASMAYMVVDKRVLLTYKGEEEKPVEEATRFAWVSIFKKQADGEWKIVCNISTNEPGLIKPAL